MTDTMIERVARVIARASALDDGKEPATAEDFTDAVWEDFVPAARAILAAMREPTEPMIDAGYKTDHASGLEGRADIGPRLAWSAMIDAALSEDA